MLAAGTASLLKLFFTIPEIVTVFCAEAAIKMNKKYKQLKNCFIRECFSCFA
jgi:hypothetical protein